MKYFLAILCWALTTAGMFLLAITANEHPLLAASIFLLVTGQYTYDMLQHFRDS